MSWLRLEVTIEREAQPQLETAIAPFRPLSMSYSDAADSPILEPAPGTAPLWPNMSVTVLFQTDISRERVLLALASHLPGLRIDQVHWSLLEDTDWRKVWRDHFRPMQFGNRLWVCPEGELPPDPGGTVLFLSPGLAFGTGTHPSTAMCLTWLDHWVQPGCSVLDYGCGSGILSIAARGLGAERVAAVDIDPQAIQATLMNAERNSMAGRLEVGPAPPEAEFDIVVANILANTLVELASLLMGKCRPGGRMALSGILDEQADEVRAAFSDRLRFEEDMSMHGWKLLHGTRTC